MLTIKAEIKRQEQKADGTYNVKVRFTLNRKVKRLSTSLFIKPSDLTKTGNFKKGTTIHKEIEQLVTGYQQKCDAMQVDLNGYSLDEIFKRLKFGEQKDKEIDFIQFSAGLRHEFVDALDMRMPDKQKPQARVRQLLAQFVDTRIFLLHG